MATRKKSRKRAVKAKRQTSAARSTTKRSTSSGAAAKPKSNRQPFYGSKSAAALSLAADNSERIAQKMGSAYAAWSKQATSSDPFSFFKPEQMQNWFADAGNSKKAQEQMYSMGRESAEQVARSADIASRSLSEVMEAGQENIEACMQSGSIAADLSKEIGDEVFGYASNLFSQSAEISRNLMSCRNINDLFDVQNRAVQNNLEEFFSETAKLSEMCFELASKASEPISNCMADTAERLTKVIAA